jgi:hypothetical protein
MPKRSSPYLRNKSEQKRDSQRQYGKLVDKPSKINPVFLRDNYGIKESGK